MKSTCYLDKFDAFRQAFHKRKEFTSVSCKLENIVNSYYLRPVLLDHVKDLLAAEHTKMGNLSVSENSKGIPRKFPSSGRTTGNIDSINNPFLHEHPYFILCRIYI
ncbi:hypothetical protein SDC9_104677 [bioreactor metagenome]|uniref:Uncharacterized protein n=1 Tax=bioreactor metagenome TaxID=1076179 RepID=A0A645B3X7_9ZZZZ